MIVEITPLVYYSAIIIMLSSLRTHITRETIENNVILSTGNDLPFGFVFLVNEFSNRIKTKSLCGSDLRERIQRSNQTAYQLAV